MNLEQIKAAVDAGTPVFWRNEEYRIVKDGTGRYFIAYDAGGRRENWIGLTWSDGETMNGEPDEFFTVKETKPRRYSAVRQTSCRHCGQDIEGFAPYRKGEWRDRGNNTKCPYPAEGKTHAPYRDERGRL